MEHTIGAFDVRRQLGKVLNDVVAKGDHYVVERHGEPIAAVVPMHVYAQWKRSRDAFFDRIEATAQHANVSEAEALSLAVEAQAAVRAERRASSA